MQEPTSSHTSPGPAHYSASLSLAQGRAPSYQMGSKLSPPKRDIVPPPGQYQSILNKKIGFALSKDRRFQSESGSGDLNSSGKKRVKTTVPGPGSYE